jgi:hypothetical protein
VAAQLGDPPPEVGDLLRRLEGEVRADVVGPGHAAPGDDRDELLARQVPAHDQQVGTVELARVDQLAEALH